MELSALSSISADETLKEFAIIGSGPLPLTSLCILQALERRGSGPPCVYNIDNDPAAISESSKLCCRLGHGEDAMCFQCADAMTDTLNLGRFDVVYVAALVGTCYEQKINIIRNTVKTMRPGGLVVLRTAHSLRILLYPVRNHYTVLKPRWKVL